MAQTRPLRNMKAQTWPLKNMKAQTRPFKNLTYMIRTWGVGHSKWAKQVRENSSSIFTHVLRRNGQVLSCCWTTSSPPRLDASRKSVTSWPEKVPLKCKVSHGYERLNPLCWEPSSQHPCSATTSVVTFDTCRKLVVDHCCFHKPPSHSQNASLFKAIFFPFTRVQRIEEFTKQLEAGNQKLRVRVLERAGFLFVYSTGLGLFECRLCA
ncbi:hypothetical protein JHK87_010391 [Glycine soja]|nr:hypothetical protein JHK87_010391 [Glycine soja]